MRTIAVLNQKGGVGKTTTTVNMAAALAKMGNKVAVVDMDPQSHLTIHLGINPETAGAGVYEVLTRSAELEENLNQVRENLFLLGANINLVGAESELVSVVGREIILREAIEKIDGKFDYLIIDCAPSLGLLTLNGLAAVEEVFIPLQPHFLALQGFGKLLQTVSLVSKRINPSLGVTGIILCMFDKRATLSSEVKTDIQNFLQNSRSTDCPWSKAQIIPVHIRRNIKLAEAPSYGQTIFEYEPECNGSFDYMAVAEYVHKKMGEDNAANLLQTEEMLKENQTQKNTPEITEQPQTDETQTPEPLQETPVIQSDAVIDTPQENTEAPAQQAAEIKLQDKRQTQTDAIPIREITSSKHDKAAPTSLTHDQQ